MFRIRCIKKDKCGNYHIMAYKNDGYYCSQCDYKELDKDWMDKDDMLKCQAERKIWE